MSIFKYNQKKGKKSQIILNSYWQLWSRLAIALALCDLNGTLRKLNKAALLHNLKIENHGLPMIPDSSRKAVNVLDTRVLV